MVHVVAICSGKRANLSHGALQTSSAIRKVSVPQARITASGLDGDEQVDRKHHGGTYKAVYSYTQDNLDYWAEVLGRPLPPGFFGENLLLAGLDETSVCVGDRFRVGGVLLEATEPRLPCRTLGIHVGDLGFIKRFLDARRLGLYFRVLEEGQVADGDMFSPEASDPTRLPVYSLAPLCARKDPGPEVAALAASHERLRPALRQRASKFCEEHDAP